MAAKKKTIDKFSMPQMFYTGTIEQLSQDGFICTEEGEWEWTNEFDSPWGPGHRYRECIYIHGAARAVDISVEEVDKEGNLLDEMDSGCWTMTPAMFAEISKLMPVIIISSLEEHHAGFAMDY